MNEYIREKLKKTKNVYFYDENNNQISINELDDQLHLIIKQKDFSVNKDNLKLFTFEDYLINPYEGFDFHIRFNNGINIPLKVMQGYIIKEVGKMYYIKVKGFYFKSNQCIHCLKEELSNPICINCFTKFNVNDIEDITWEGYVPKKGIKEIVDL